MRFVIESNVEIPKVVRRGRPRKYPFPEMDVDQSFGVEVEGQEHAERMARNLRSLANGLRKTPGNEDKRFTCRVVSPNEVRCWRVK